MGLRVGGLVAVLTTAFAACGGGGDEAAQGTESAPVAASEAVETTADVPSTSAATTSTTTTAPTTTNAPTTTIDPAEALAAEVEADFREGWRLLRLAQQDPTDSEAAADALRYFSNSSAVAVMESLESYQRGRVRILEDPLVDPAVVIEIPATQLEGVDTVRIQACVADPWILVESGGAPDGSDAIVDDTIYAYRNRVVLTRVDGIWTSSDSVELAQWSGRADCPAG
jgi:hypothetical protein